jgi:hypothetical protein
MPCPKKIALRRAFKIIFCEILILSILKRELILETFRTVHSQLDHFWSSKRSKTLMKRSYKRSGTNNHCNQTRSYVVS